MIKLRDIAIAGVGAIGGVLWYEYVCQRLCEKGRMYRVLKGSDGTYQVYGNVDIIPPEEKDKNAAEAEPWEKS